MRDMASTKSHGALRAAPETMLTCREAPFAAADDVRCAFLGLAGLICLAAGLLLSEAKSHAAQSSPEQLDLSGYRLTFEEDFETLSVSAWGPVGPPFLPGTSRWIAHTPWNGDFGDAQFANPAPGFPFTIDNGVLRIEARREPDGKWRSGLLASTDPNGNGFVQQHGYFEMRAKFPGGPGVWPAFWLIGNRSSEASAEIDVVEYYGKFPNGYQAVVHVWPKTAGVRHKVEKRNVEVPSGTLSSSFHTYGALVDSKFIIFYLDRVEVARVSTPPEHNQPLFMLLNLALGSGWPIDETPNPSYMFVDYVRAYARTSQ